MKTTMKTTIFTLIFAAGFLITAPIKAQGIGAVIDNYVDESISTLEAKRINTSNMYVQCYVGNNGASAVCNTQETILGDVEKRNSYSLDCMRVYVDDSFVGLRCDIRADD